MKTLRDFQVEDVANTIAMLDKHRKVLGRAATGLGKGAVLAALAAYYANSGRVLLMVDTRKLVRQLAAEIKEWTGTYPGIEMAEDSAINENAFCPQDQIVVACVQTLYSGEKGKERYRRFSPEQFSLVAPDECESSLAPKYREVIEYFLQNPCCKLFGCTATPIRTDGLAMANLYNEIGFDRDIRWGIENGWLVRPRQAFVQVSLDMSSLRVLQREDGEPDYSDSQLAALINNERTLLELAKGIVRVAEKRKSIVVCPDVASARAVAHYIDAEVPGQARCIYGTLGDEEREEIFDDYAAGRFQWLSSCSLLTKGFNDPPTSAVFVCRKTKSQRLYIQICGRVVRPLDGIVDGLPDAECRKEAIAESAKPDALVVNMVGIDESVRDMTLVNILGEPDEDEEIRQRAKQLVEKEQLEVEEAIAQAETQIGDEQEAERAAAEAEAIQIELDEESAFLRRRVQVDAHVQVEYHEGTGAVESAIVGAEYIPPQQLNLLRKMKVPESAIAGMSPEIARDLSRKLIMRSKKGLCTYAQGSLLMRSGYTKQQVSNMSREEAGQHIDRIVKR